MTVLTVRMVRNASSSITPRRARISLLKLVILIAFLSPRTLFATGLDYRARRLLVVLLFWPVLVSAEGEHERDEPRDHPIAHASAQSAELPEAVLRGHQVLVRRSAAGHRRSGGHVEAIQENGTASVRLRLDPSSTRELRPATQSGLIGSLRPFRSAAHLSNQQPLSRLIDSCRPKSSPSVQPAAYQPDR